MNFFGKRDDMPTNHWYSSHRSLGSPVAATGASVAELFTYTAL